MGLVEKLEKRAKELDRKPMFVTRHRNYLGDQVLYDFDRADDRELFEQAAQALREGANMLVNVARALHDR